MYKVKTVILWTNWRSLAYTSLSLWKGELCLFVDLNERQIEQQCVHFHPTESKR